MNLTTTDQFTIARARELAAVKGVDAACEFTGQDDIGAALAGVLGAAQVVLGDLVAIIERQAGR